ncbi:coatomer subunit zeta-2 isoform X2 [Engystomops pustulosus]|uniref:coatomer subunit zeta-2 isoform X2 n=1 Tax=Engystomops pustulosus TaxID=76066 RepID=UPI003AFAB7A0
MEGSLPVLGGELTRVAEGDPTLYTVRAAIILDQDGHRLVAKYYDCTFPSLVEQQEFEKKLFLKTQRSESEVVLVDGVTALCQRSSDVMCFIIGGPDENELMLLSALTCLCESLYHILRMSGQMPGPPHTAGPIAATMAGWPQTLQTARYVLLLHAQLYWSSVAHACKVCKPLSIVLNGTNLTIFF